MVTNKTTSRTMRLTEAEGAVSAAIPIQVDLSRVRLYRGDCHGAARWIRSFVLSASRNRAVALGNHVFLPARCQGDPGVLAHELTHCGQYQEWGPLTYFVRAAAAQCKDLLHRKLGIGSSPYEYQVEPDKPFTSYGIEQQAQMVEDRFRILRPDQAMPSA